MQIPVIASVVYALIRLIGPTLRIEFVGWRNIQCKYDQGKRMVGTFWHRSIFCMTWIWRHRGTVVMNTPNFDGQWTRRVIERLGFGTAQGSSSRGGLKGLLVMAKKLEEGHDVAFTIDGPRGPRYVAKPGPVMLARRTGQPIVMVHIGIERGHTFEKSWDLFKIPYPFSRVVFVMVPTIDVPADADRDMMERKHAEMQAGLERVRDIAEGWFTMSEEERNRIRTDLNGAPGIAPAPFR